MSEISSVSSAPSAPAPRSEAPSRAPARASSPATSSSEPRDKTKLSDEVKLEDYSHVSLERSFELCTGPMPDRPIDEDSPFKREHKLVRELMTGKDPTDAAFKDRPMEELITEMLRSHAPTTDQTFQDAVNLDAEAAKRSGSYFLDQERMSTMLMRSPVGGENWSNSYLNDLGRLNHMLGAGCLARPTS